MEINIESHSSYASWMGECPGDTGEEHIESDIGERCAATTVQQRQGNTSTIHSQPEAFIIFQ
jgi:hypothetical protein